MCSVNIFKLLFSCSWETDWFLYCNVNVTLLNNSDCFAKHWKIYHFAKEGQHAKLTLSASFLSTSESFLPPSLQSLLRKFYNCDSSNEVVKFVKNEAVNEYSELNSSKTAFSPSWSPQRSDSTTRAYVVPFTIMRVRYPAPGNSVQSSKMYVHPKFPQCMPCSWLR